MQIKKYENKFKKEPFEIKWVAFLIFNILVATTSFVRAMAIPINQHNHKYIYKIIIVPNSRGQASLTNSSL